MVTEKNINLIENLIKEFKTYNDLDGIENLKPYIEAIEHLMKEYKEKNVCYNTAYNLGKSFEYNKWISEIKEMIKVIHKKEKEELKGLKGQDRYFVKQIYQAMKKPLEKIMEERKC